jgi:hypothetical protein
MNDPTGPWATAQDIAAAVAGGIVSAEAVTEAALDRIAALNPVLNAYTDITAARARAEAAAVDAARAAGRALGPLAGVPFAVKNLFDVTGLPTRAGSRINRERAPAGADASLIQRMNRAGAVLLGGLNMGEYAYDFTGENAHDGACRNPHDTGRMTGGSSSGCGGATAGGDRAAVARVRHQRVAARARGSVRCVQPEADLWPACRAGGPFPSWTVWIIWAPWRARRAIWRWRMTSCKGRTGATTPAPPRPRPCGAALDLGVAGLKIGVLGGVVCGSGG